MSREAEDTQYRERAVLVYVNSIPEEDEYVETELKELAAAAGLEVIAEFRQRRARPETSTFLGQGKTEELYIHLQDMKADVVIIDAELTPIQQRNLHDFLKVKVIDRPQLILDIFAQRAHTREGILQVELAQLNYLLPRISQIYTQFERQQGGIGVRGPGETKLESDRRVIKQRISALIKELEDIRKQRHHQRVARRKKPFPFGVIVGYTSAGKSTLLNTLGGADVYTDAKLFATLDPTTRRVVMPDGYSVFLTDTVGFIRNLPHHLIAAFRATLEEVTEADFLVHVIDVSHINWDLQYDAVIDTLTELNAADKPILTVFNKSDLIDDAYMLRDVVSKYPNSVYISAKKAQGLQYFMESLEKLISNVLRAITALIPYDRSELVSDCYEFGRVRLCDYREEGIYMQAEIVEELYAKLAQYSVKKEGSQAE